MKVQVKIKTKEDSGCSAFKEDSECFAYKEAKANNAAFILEDGWIIRVYADNHKEKIKYIGNTNINIKDLTDKEI